jgi:tellurite resistance protein TehA-like permease
MSGMMEGGGAMMWGMGLFWLLVIIVLLLAGAALIKYLRSGRQKGQRHD